VHFLGREMKGREVENLFEDLHGGHIFSTPLNREEPRCTYVHPLPTNVVLVRYMALIFMRPSPIGWGRPEN
jgi:hypothetical protein